jgi:hypothetical protein
MLVRNAPVLYTDHLEVRGVYEMDLEVIIERKDGRYWAGDPA